MNEYNREKNSAEANLSRISKLIKELQELYFKIGSTNENKILLIKVDEIIEKTADLLFQTFKIISNIINREDENKSDKIKKNKLALDLEEHCNKYKNRFDNLVEKIKNVDLLLLQSTKSSLNNSLRLSKFSLKNNHILTEERSFTDEEEQIHDNVMKQREKQINLIKIVKEKLNETSKNTSKLLRSQEISQIEKKKEEKIINKVRKDFYYSTKNDLRDSFLNVNSRKEINRDEIKMRIMKMTIVFLILLFIIILLY